MTREAIEAAAVDSRISELEAALSDEEASHADTLRLLALRDAEIAALRSLSAPSPLLAIAEKLAEACEGALEHVTELRDAWMRGAIREFDTIGMGATRSNRNVDVETQLRAALAIHQVSLVSGDAALESQSPYLESSPIDPIIQERVRTILKERGFKNYQ